MRARYDTVLPPFISIVGSLVVQSYRSPIFFLARTVSNCCWFAGLWGWLVGLGRPRTTLGSRLSFPATEPPDPRRVSEAFQKGSLKGFRRVLEGF